MWDVVAEAVGETFTGTWAVVAWAGVALLGLSLVLWIIDVVLYHVRRHRAESQLGVRIPKGFRIRPAKVARSSGAFVLVYPRWRNARKDGTRNLRYRNNEVVEGLSTLEVGRWRLSSRCVFALYDFVVALRGRGHVIALSNEEAEKLTRLNEQEELRTAGVSRSRIYHRFASQPTQFEQFCAELYRGLGQQVEVTPPIADGGFDLRVLGPEGVTLVECKCFHPAQCVGRPVLQKLFGANAVEGAQHLVVMTTAAFSREARNYAQEVGMELIDGATLTTLCDQVWGGRPPVQGPTVQEVQLTREEHLEHFPADIRERYAALV